MKFRAGVAASAARGFGASVTFYGLRTLAELPQRKRLCLFISHPFVMRISSSVVPALHLAVFLLFSCSTHARAAPAGPLQHPNSKPQVPNIPAAIAVSANGALLAINANGTITALGSSKYSTGPSCAYHPGDQLRCFETLFRRHTLRN
jgi:hypothetical protein